MVLCKLPVPGRPKIFDYSMPTALTEGADGGVRKLLLSSTISVFFLPLSGRRPGMLKYCLNGPVTQNNQPTKFSQGRARTRSPS